MKTKIEVENISTIEELGTGYIGWSTIAGKSNGEIVIVYSGGRRHHICPFGQVHILTSAMKDKVGRSREYSPNGKMMISVGKGSPRLRPGRFMSLWYNYERL